MKKEEGGSRLQKLLRLIEGGSSLDTRRAAAQQIAAVVASHPSQLPSVLSHISPFLRNKDWDARAAAGHCLGCIAKHVDHHTPATLAAAAGAPLSDSAAAGGVKPDEATAGEELQATALLSFESFSVEAVLRQGTLLVASAGAEFDAGSLAAGASKADNLAQQRNNLKKRLGLGGAAEAFINTDDFFADEDLIGTSPAMKKEPGEVKQGADELLAGMAGMSARERAAALRRAKAEKRRAENTGLAAPSGKRAKTESSADGNAASGSNVAVAVSALTGADVEELEAEWEAALAGRWPFQQLCNQLCVDLLHPRWETRHGAALAMREILSSHAAAAAVAAPAADPPLGWTAAGGAGKVELGVTTAVDVAAATAANAAWLQDCAIHMLCTLALDRFGDYLSDQVVAPVRETTAQALGAAARAFDRSALLRLLGTLRTLAESSEWEARHGGLQGLKYVLAGQESLDAELLAAAVPASISGLQDRDDDVRAVAAEALLPAAALLAADTSPAAARARALTWDALLAEEELSPAVRGATSLLAAVYSSETPGGTAPEGSLAALVPRLWPHLRHNLTSVRLSAVKCLLALLGTRPVGGILPGAELGRAARLLFQNFLLEPDSEVLNQTRSTWNALVDSAPAADLAVALSGGLQAMLTLASTPAHRKFDARLLVVVPLPGGTTPALQLQPGGASEPNGNADQATRMRVFAAQALGRLAHACSSLPENPLVPLILGVLRSGSACARILGGFLVAHWAKFSPALVTSGLQSAVEGAVAALTTPPAIFDELIGSYAHLRRQVAGLVEVAAQGGVQLQLPCPAEAILAEAAAVVSGQIPDAAPHSVKLAAHTVATTATVVSTSEAVLKVSVSAALAAGVIFSGQLPQKLNMLIQPLIGAVRRDPQPLLQDHAAEALARLVVACAPRTPSPSEKIVKNVCGFACSDPAALPSVTSPPKLAEDEADNGQQNGKGAGAIKKGQQQQAAPAPVEDATAQAAALARRGGEAALRAIGREGGPSLPSLLPGLWSQTISAALAAAASQGSGLPTAQAAVEALRTLQVLAPALHAGVVPELLRLLPALAACLAHLNTAVQLSAARALAALACAHSAALMPPALAALSPLLAAGAPDAARLGGVVALRETLAALGLRAVPFVQLTVVPLLARMGDPHPDVRAVASRCFASAVALMPLAQGVPPPPGLSPEQEALLAREGQFLQQLLDNRKMDDFLLPFQLKIGTLRRYQQEGINWLAFLRRFGLHGVLADDMGLGKTLQATAMVAATTLEARVKFAATRDPVDAPRPALIVCPATLVAHWPHEIEKFVDESVLRPLQYHGAPAARAALRRLVGTHDVVVMSYEAMRADVEWVSGVKWSYCILDEGHAIRNPGSRIAQAARRVEALHRIILSGTPIQNSVQEMWALFDFLMPGFLGGERAFNARYGKALASSRGAKRGSAESEAGILALDALHRQVMPFVLRRTKDQVLKDLPPKTVQDVMCEPGDLQRALYEDFSGSQAMAAVAGAASAEGGGAAAAGGAGAQPHVFQALHYLRKLCSHPLLVLDPSVPAHAKALASVLGPGLAADWGAAQKHLRTHLHHSPKLAALKELLVDCGIGTDPTDRGKEAKDEALASHDAGHRALVFAQTRAMLDLVESSVLEPLGVDSLRIDGAVDAAERFARVQRFNADPTVEVMLLTTAVGGLGLNLTAADTVIFLEHDWNPQKDLQAMDRAHRLGQRRAVNVYRLLVRGTLEEQIMSLQRFKLDVAAAVVNADNMSMTAMDTGNLLDLFVLQEGEKGGKKEGGVEGGAAAAAKGGKSGLAAVLAELTDPEAAEAQYGEEFDLQAFKQKLNPKN